MGTTGRLIICALAAAIRSLHFARREVLKCSDGTVKVASGREELLTESSTKYSSSGTHSASSMTSFSTAIDS
jgi:hypothetical protein